jgi:Asp-tRNA(Asn)/Glu-tRNA(Gln) amidotransferase A subunit family amidase
LRSKVELNRLSACELAERLQTRDVRAIDIVESCLARIAARESAIHAWMQIDPERARAHARALDAGPVRGALHGLPLGVKDIFDTCDSPTEYGSPIYAGHRPAADAACVALARAAGAIVLGKTTTAEFATYTPAATVNPRNVAHTPGGSSSGSAAAVADDMVPFAFGTQTAGSVIRPASYCGIVGYKPSFGMIGRAGVKLVAESLDTIGVLARTVADAALLVGALTARGDLLTLPKIDGRLRIGICKTHDWSHTEAAVGAVLTDAERTLAAAGADLAAIDLPSGFTALHDEYDAIYGYEIVRSLTHEHRAHRRQLSARLAEMLDSGTAITAERYDRARRVTDNCRRRLADAFGACDVLLAPSTTGEAPEGLASTGSPIMNGVWTLLHAPCVSVPAGTGPRGLPIGLQVVGRVGDDARTVAAAAWIGRELVGG